MKKGVRIGEPEAMCHLEVMPSLGLDKEPIPLWWTGDFILASPEGTPAEEEKWIIGEFNCSCVGISKCLQETATSPNQGLRA